jgi:hypothetical protein
VVIMMFSPAHQIDGLRSRLVPTSTALVGSQDQNGRVFQESASKRYALALAA